MTTPLTGDSNNRETRNIPVAGIWLHRIEVDQVTELTDAEHPINQAARSGKKRGAMLLIQSEGFPPTVLVAAGSGNTAPWYNGVNGTIFATPS